MPGGASACDFGALAQWVEASNGTVGAVRPARFGLAQLPPDLTERGLAATTATPAGSTLFSVPESLILSTRNNSALAPLLAGADPPLSTHATLALLLLLELRKANTSRYAPYLACLPVTGARVGDEEGETSSAAWSESQLSELQASHAAIAARRLHSQLHAEYSLLFPRACRAVPALCSGTAADLPPSERLYRRARLLVQSRAVRLPSRVPPSGAPSPPAPLALVPLLDLINHAPASTGRASTWHVDKRGALSVRSGCALGAGEEILISYGDHSSAALLLRFGFVPRARTPADAVALRLPPLPPPAASASATPQAFTRVRARLLAPVPHPPPLSTSPAPLGDS